jgi:hypothetical protein
MRRCCTKIFKPKQLGSLSVKSAYLPTLCQPSHTVIDYLDGNTYLGNLDNHLKFRRMRVQFPPRNVILCSI